MTVELLAMTGGLVLLVVLGVLAMVNQVSDHETSIFTIVVGALLALAALTLLAKAGIQ